MKTCALLFGLMTYSAFAVEIQVPASNLLAASKTIIGQSAPFYNVSGNIRCNVVSSGYRPSTYECQINVKGVTVSVNQAYQITEAVSKAIRFTSPTFKFSGEFKATSNQSDFPPYKVREEAIVIIK